MEPEPDQRDRADDMLRVQLLGGFRVSRGDQLVDDASWRLSKARSLVKLLALAPGARLHREQVIELLWPDLPPESAANNLHQVLFAARRALASVLPPGSEHAIVLRQGMLALAPAGGLWIDVDAFDRAAAAALTSDDPSSGYAAVDLYQGELLPEDRYEDWAGERREELAEHYLAVLVTLARLHEARGEHAPAIDALRRLTAIDPLREEAHVALMRLYALTGRQQQALRQYERLRDTLERELDSEPDPATDRLYRQILDHRFPPQPAQRPASRPAPAPVATTPPSAPPAEFVNRERELAQLRATLERAAGGRGTIALVSGEPGIGKTRTMEELAREARERGIAVRWGRCYEGQASTPWWPWVQVVRDELREGDPATLAADLGPAAADIARLVPELHARLPGLPDLPALDPDQERVRLFDGVAGFLASLAARAPLLLVFDDLQWADRSSLLLLEFLADELRARRVLVLGAYRDTGLERGSPLSGALPRLTRDDASVRLRLAGLSAPHVAEVSRIATGQPPPAGLVDIIHRQTEGNPLFVREVVRLLVDEGRYSQPADVRSWQVTIPAGVRETVALRLDRLPHDTSRLLATASAIGREFDLEVLATVSEQRADAVLDALEEAIAAGVLEELPERPGAFSFAHALIQATLYDDLSRARRSGLHRRIGEALEARAAAGHDVPMADIARHFALALPGGDPEKAIDYAARAGDQALVRVAWSDAVDDYERALDLLERWRSDDRARRCRVLLALGEALTAAGDTERARATFDAAVDVARALGEHRLLARSIHGVAEAMWHVGAAVDETGLALLHEAVATLTERDGIDRVRAIGDLVRELATSPVGNHESLSLAASLADEAQAIAQRLADPVARLTAALARQWVVSRSDDPRERLANADELLALATDLNDRRLMLQIHAWRFFDLMEIGDMPGADAALDAYEALAVELHQPHNLWSARFRRAMRALMRAEFTDAERLIEEARSSGQRSATQQADLVAVLQTAQLRIEQSRAGEVLARVAEAAATQPHPSHIDCVSLLAAAESGRIADARRAFDELATDQFASVPRDLRWTDCITLLADVCVVLEARGPAGVLYQLLRPLDGRNVSGGGNMNCYGPVALALGRLSLLCGDVAAARRHLEDALAFSERMQSPLFVAHACVALARVLDHEGDAPTRQRAAELRARARELAARHGLARVEALASAAAHGATHGHSGDHDSVLRHC